MKTIVINFQKTNNSYDSLELSTLSDSIEECYVEALNYLLDNRHMLNSIKCFTEVFVSDED